jgi:hypothetical protein
MQAPMGRTCLSSIVLSLACVLALAGCEGPVGPKGDPGPPGDAPDLGPAPDLGEPQDLGPSPDLSVAPDLGQPVVPPGTIVLEPDGLVGRVSDTTGAVVAGARVVLVPASEVAALGTTAIDHTLLPAAALAATNDEPIEDLIDANRATLTSATTDLDGVYRFVTLPAFDVFVVVVPAATDTGHLPGGEQARIGQARASLVGQRVDLTVSTFQSPDATYVGSSACTVCHGKHSLFGTSHFSGLNVPGRRGYFEDTSRWPTFDAALARFDAGVTLHFYDCGVPAGAPCKVSETVPPGGAVLAFDAALSRVASIPLGEPGAYSVTLTNRRAGGGSATYAVDLTYGGVLARQAFIVSVTRSGGVEHHVLPFQFQHNGDATAPAAATRPSAWPWADVGSANWYDFTAGALRVPGSLVSFDRSCAGCHFTGFQLAGDATSGFRASAIPTMNGAADYDQDGRLEDVNVGCEGCHGPGSEHIAASGRGVAIVSPGLLLAERQDAICGTCHASSSAGALLDSAGNRPRPGVRRSELLGTYYTGPELVAADTWPSGDPRRPQIEYAMHTGSTMARNGRLLTACSGCHDAHGNPAALHDLNVPLTDNTLCTTCHSGADFLALDPHVNTVTGVPDHEPAADNGLYCVKCHMPPTAFGGAAVIGLRDGNPSTAVVQHWMGDIATHRYRPSLRDLAMAQPTTVTQDCAGCHPRFIPNI